VVVAACAEALAGGSEVNSGAEGIWEGEAGECGGAGWSEVTGEGARGAVSSARTKAWGSYPQRCGYSREAGVPLNGSVSGYGTTHKALKRGEAGVAREARRASVWQGWRRGDSSVEVLGIERSHLR